jgi:glycosyltransferase involved in cell wall biosynthesis
VVDPDRFLQRTGSGIVAGPGAAAAAAAIRRLANDPQEWRRASSNIRAYVERHHDSGRCAAAFARSVVELASVPQDWNRRSAHA